MKITKIFKCGYFAVMGSINELTFISEYFFDIFRDIKSIYFAMASLLSGLTDNLSTVKSMVIKGIDKRGYSACNLSKSSLDTSCQSYTHRYFHLQGKIYMCRYILKIPLYNMCCFLNLH